MFNKSYRNKKMDIFIRHELELERVFVGFKIAWLVDSSRFSKKVIKEYHIFDNYSRITLIGDKSIIKNIEKKVIKEFKDDNEVEIRA